LLHEIDYQPHTYMATVDLNNRSRVFNRFTEYNVDYSKPPQQAWTITNFWGFGLPALHVAMEDGLCSAITLTNNRTYALLMTLTTMEVVCWSNSHQWFCGRPRFTSAVTRDPKRRRDLRSDPERKRSDI
jgi:hypothetical protein